MSNMKDGLDKLTKLIDECHEFHHLTATGTKDGIIIQLVQDDEICFNGEEITKEEKEKVICNWHLGEGAGSFSYEEKTLLNDCVYSMCICFKKYLDAKERNAETHSNCIGALSALRRLVRQAPVLTYMAQAYQRLESIIGIPRAADLTELSDSKLKKIQKRIEEFSAQLETGGLIYIANIAVLHPLVSNQKGCSSYVIDPRIQTYRTGTPEAAEFKECLRRASRLSK